MEKNVKSKVGTKANKIKTIRKQLANEIFDLYKKLHKNFVTAEKDAWVRHLLAGELRLGYKSIEELTEWRNRLVKESKAA